MVVDGDPDGGLCVAARAGVVVTSDGPDPREAFVQVACFPIHQHNHHYDHFHRTQGTWAPIYGSGCLDVV